MSYLRENAKNFKLITVFNDDGTLELKVDDGLGGLVHLCKLTLKPRSLYKNEYEAPITAYELANRAMKIIMKPEIVERLLL